MTRPTFSSSISPEIEQVIQSKLTALEADHDVRVLFAIESGSRVWGFPSPDSDYNVRFTYALRTDWYLSIEPGRDVIELPIEGDCDINGWDIREALGLLTKPNPVLLEWLSSPIRYRWNDAVCERLIAFAARTTYGESCLHHYRHLAQKQWDKHVSESQVVIFKAYFYILRPALAISWIRQISGTPPPINLHDLVKDQDLLPDLIGYIEGLLTLKSKPRKWALGCA
ncbi:nucleotidyltransferase domain-containing protein [Ruegeria sp. AU67]|uniref:nucleotidyltransferase domain-containing protein n=1 Tax=Ruegeria sp. AU67 TaxID=2108530 RepID=UPI000D6935B8|nr:nucleotidyltransferase domain-containing protein [Ruegeria sp. AU67]